MITKGQIMIKKYILLMLLVLFAGNLNAEEKLIKWYLFLPVRRVMKVTTQV